MHGPAVASLLAGAHCGTAPGARLYFVATSDPGKGVQEHVSALDWILATNAHLPPAQKIRVVSISASPDGDRVKPDRSAGPWPAARARAEQAGVLVLDCSRASAFIGPCALDPLAPEDPARCQPVLAQGRPDFFAGHLLAPVVPRTTAEQYFADAPGYQYCGNNRETHLYHGVSWAVPYCAGVLALGWQLRPDLTPAQMRELLFLSAHVLPTGEKIINPPEFIRLVREAPSTTPAERQL
jgi:subtilisin family serine protease